MASKATGQYSGYLGEKGKCTGKLTEQIDSLSCLDNEQDAKPKALAPAHLITTIRERSIMMGKK